jgi:hypothetical protein
MSEKGKKTTVPRPEYFTCTVAEALEYNKKHHRVKVSATAKDSIIGHEHYGNINEFVDFLSANYGEDLAIGCAFPPRKLEVPGAERHNQDTSFDDELANVEQLGTSPMQRQC